MMRHRFHQSAIFPLIFAAPVAIAAQPEPYAYYDLGGPGIPNGINDHGIVIRSGHGEPDNGLTQFRWDNGTLVDLEQFWEGGEINDGGRIANTGAIALRGSLIGDPKSVFLMIDGNLPIEMMIPAECFDIGDPEAITSNGASIAGDCRFDDQFQFPERLVVYDTTTTEATMVGLPPNATKGSEASPYGMNDHGVIVGIMNYEGEPDNRRAFIYQDGVISEFENPWGGVDTALLDINNLGLAVGEGEDALGNDCGFSYDMNTGEVMCLDYGHPQALNDRGDAVGWQNFDWVGHAVLYSKGETIDLNPYLPSDHFNPFAEWINNYGWITGFSKVDDILDFGWLLVPIYDKGDCDGDGDVDFQDFGKFQECFAAEPYQGPEGGLHVGCSVFDFDDDVDLDLDDYAAFQNAFTGPTAPDLNPYGPG